MKKSSEDIYSVYALPIPEKSIPFNTAPGPLLWDPFLWECDVETVIVAPNSCVSCDRQLGSRD